MIFALISMLSNSALAADHGASIELGTLGAYDQGWETFRERNNLPSFGVQAQVAVHDRVAVVGSYHRHRAGALHSFNLDRFESGVPGGGEGFVASFTGNTFGLGVRADIEPVPILQPYVSASGLLVQGTARLDDDTDDDENPNQIVARGVAPGFAVAGGGQLLVGAPSWTVAPTLYLEMGYNWTTQLDLDALGDVAFRGFYLRTGLGVRF